MGSAHSGVLSPCVSPASGSAAVSAAHPPPPPPLVDLNFLSPTPRLLAAAPPLSSP
ncbi:hypothetical protein PR002_g13292 [Phytophthora rubi]|uniref:Uncharacterized protein n=1 Tax=Phytophthora rubi TaxID=129364 RepID=A0A6A3LIM3_9STRA|nr:hypothetical protein PR002_g13292 [Phytophthora rubi]